MTDHESDDEPIVGECFFCKQTREIIATMTVSATGGPTDRHLGTTGERDACEECVQCAILEMRELRMQAGADREGD